MIKVLKDIFSIKDIRDKVIFTLVAILFFRIGTHVTIPGINSLIVSNIASDSSSSGVGFVNVIDLFAGGALLNFSIFALGIMPYISSSIIMQLLMVLFPQLKNMQREEGEQGQKKINQYIKYGTVFLCIIQSLAVIQLARSWSFGTQNSEARYPGLISPSVEPFFIYIAIISIVSGSMLLVWLGEQITQRGVGNGISLLIFAGIVGRMPQSIIQMFTGESSDPLSVLILIILFIFLISLTVILTRGERRLSLNYSNQQSSSSNVSQYISFKVNSANVMPIIFASSLLLFPQTIIQWFASYETEFISWSVVADFFNPFSQVWYRYIFYYLLYSFLIIFFAYFYTSIQFNPLEISNNLKKYGGFIYGIRPGLDTKNYIEKVLSRITLPGAFFLACLALAPYIIIKFLNLGTSGGATMIVYTFGGTSLLIMVGVALDTLKQIESHLLMRNYNGFFENKKIRSRRMK